MSARFSHAACAHPSTKVARAACRRQMAKLITAVFDAVVIAPAESEILKSWYEMKAGPLELTAAPTAAPAAVSFDVTRENWRDVKTMISTVSLNDGEIVKGNITGWSANLLQIKVDGKLRRIPAANVLSVIA